MDEAKGEEPREAGERKRRPAPKRGAVQPRGRVRERTWLALEHAPCWAVVRALGKKHGSDSECLHGLRTLAASLGRWAAPHAAGAAERAGVQLAARPDPARIEALLQAWLWPQAMPPLPAVAA